MAPRSDSPCLRLHRLRRSLRCGAVARVTCGCRRLRRGWRAWAALRHARTAAAELDERATAARRRRAWLRLIVRGCTRRAAHSCTHAHLTRAPSSSSSPSINKQSSPLCRRRAALLAASLARLTPAYFARQRAVRLWHSATVARAAARRARRARRAHRTFEVRRSEGLSAGGHAVRLALRRWAHRTLGCLHLVEWLLAQRCEVMRSAMHRWRASTAGRRLHCRAGMRDLLWA